MARDYGDRGELGGRRARFLRLGSAVALTIGVAGPVLAFAAFPTLVGIGTGAHDPHEPSRGVQGQPCPPESQARFEAGWRLPPRRFSFQGASFARRRGDADCVVMHDGPLGGLYPACRFTSPGALGVTAAGRALFYDVPPGETVEVEVRPTGVRCMMTGRRSLEDLIDGY